MTTAFISPGAAKTIGEVGKVVAPFVLEWALNRATDAIFDPGPSWSGEEPPNAEMSTADLASGITIVNNNNIDLTGANNASTAMNLLADRDEGPTTLKNHLETLPGPDTTPLQEKIARATPVDERVYRDSEITTSGITDNLPEEMKKELKRMRRGKKLDRQRVSMEYHEFVYNTRLPGGDVHYIHDIIFGGNAEVSYARWVHAESMRRAIEKLRTLRRVAFGKNSKQILTLVGQTREQFLQNLVVNSVELQALFSQAVTQWNEINV